MYKNWCIIITLTVFFFNLDKIKEYEKSNVPAFLIFNVLPFTICLGETYSGLTPSLNHRVASELIVSVSTAGMTSQVRV